MQRVQTVFLGIIAACLLLITADRWLSPAEAAGGLAGCEVLELETTNSNKKALENLENHKKRVAESIGRRAADGQYPVYHVTIPIPDRFGAGNSFADLVCFAKAP